ncbi:MAG: MFS transporter [Thermodesulfovibrionales bacterium]
MLKNLRQTISWCLFDFANSSYSAVIASVIFPVYFTSYIAGNDHGLGDLWWGRAISLSMVIVVLTSPFLGGIADFSGLRKRFLILYTITCVASVALLSLLKKGMVIEGFFLITVANIGMEGGLVFYNSFLPEIAPREYQGRVSSWGYGIGYLGSISSLLISIPLINTGNINYAWIMVSLFFMLFSIPAFLYLPSDKKTGLRVSAAATEGLRFSIRGLKKIWYQRETRKFLIAYLIYEDGVNTVIVFSSIFAATTLGFTGRELIMLYILVQVTALIGSFLMARPIDYVGPKKIVTTSLIMWTVVSFLAYFVHDKEHFWIIAMIAGLGLGTIQAASRAFYTQFIPRGSETEYFGVYAMIGKSSAIAGPLLFGYISATTGSQRPAILTVSIFFMLGLVVLQMVKGGGPNIRASS